MKGFIALLFSLLVLPLAAQEARFGEKVDVNLVLLDAVVTDAKGNQILGLDKGDFTVLENGAPQKIDSVEYFTNRTLVTSSEENAPFKVERVHEGRRYVIFFDKPSDTQLWQQVTAAAVAAEKFVDSLQPGDQVAVTGHDVRLEVYSDFTGDHERLHRAIHDASSFSRGETSGAGPILGAVDRHRMMSGTGTVYEALEVLGDSLRSIRGRKDLILFSAGILEPGQDVRHGVVLNESRYYKPMIDALNAANVSVYALNLLREDAPEVPAFHQTLEEIAHDTNGDYYRHPVNFEPLLQRIEQHTNGYYLISYTSHHPSGERGFQRVDVKISSPELRISARRGYIYGSAAGTSAGSE